MNYKTNLRVIEMEVMIMGVFTESENKELQFEAGKLKPFKGKIEWDNLFDFHSHVAVKIVGEISDEYGDSVIEGELFSGVSIGNGSLKFSKKYKDQTTFIYNLRRNEGGWFGYWFKQGKRRKDSLDIEDGLDVDGFVYLSFCFINNK